MIKGITNFGHAVKNIDQSASVYASLWGIPLAKKFSSTQEGVNNAVFPVPPNFAEMLEPADSKGTLARFIDRKGEGIYHLVFLTDSVEKEVRSLRQKGVVVNEAPALDSGLQKRAWVHPRSTMGVLFELIEVDPLKQWGLQNTPKKGLVLKISHIHHIVKDLDKAVALYERIWGLRPNQRHDYPAEGFSNAIIPIGSNYIGILCPTNAKHPLWAFLEKKGEGLRSVCFLVEDIDKAVDNLRGKGVEPFVQQPGLSTPFKAAWISPKYTHGLVVELFPVKEASSYMAGG